MILVIACSSVMLALWTLGRPHRLAHVRSGRSGRSIRSILVGDSGRSSLPQMPGVADAPGSDTISVVIPARNEVANLPVLLGSLVASTTPAHEVIVVDDHSVDGTAAVAAACGAQVLMAPALPAGWAGKSWACHTGAAAATSPLLLFLDADTCLAPDALAHLQRVHAEVGGLVSVQPFHEVRRPYEQLSAVFNLVSMMGSAAFSLRSPSRRSSVGMAFGPCLLTTAADYRRSGGHEAVRGEIVEDIALAERYRAADLPVTCWTGGRSIAFRMYPDGFRSLAQGWTKNIALGAGRAPLTDVVPAVMWVAAVIAVWVTTIPGLIGWADNGPAPVIELAAWAFVTVHLVVALRVVGSYRVVTSILFIVPLAFFVAIFVRSGVTTLIGAPVTWRGRRVATREGS